MTQKSSKKSLLKIPFFTYTDLMKRRICEYSIRCFLFFDPVDSVVTIGYFVLLIFGFLLVCPSFFLLFFIL